MFTTAFGDRITAARIGQFLSVNGKALEHSYVRVASGKSVTTPSANIGDFFRSEQMNRNVSKYDRVIRSIDEVSGLLDYTESANRMIWDDISQMQGMVKDYYAPGASTQERSILEKQFNEAKFRIVKTQDGAVYDGKEVLRDSSNTPLISINTNPHELDQRYTVSFDADVIVNTLALDITAGKDAIATALEEQFGRAAAFAGKLTGYRYGIQAQRKLSEVIGEGTERGIDSIQDFDDAQELFNMTKRSIQQQAALSMFAQSGMSQAGLLKLVG